MEERMKINENVTVGAQPSEEHLRGLSRQGFRTIVNLRMVGEDEQPLSPAAEGEKVRALGMEYLHIPVSTKEMKAEQVDEFRGKVAALPKPLYAHCRRGKCAGAFVMMDLAVGHGMSGDQTLQQAEQMGFECDQPELMEFVKTYVDQRRT
jgi:uncharacterized protein (TIGR01244 family)